MKTLINIVSILTACVLLLGAKSAYATEQDIWQELQKRQRQDLEARMIAESRAEIKSVTAGLVTAPMTLAAGFCGTIGAIKIGMDTSATILTMTGFQDFALGAGLCAGCLVSVACFYALYCMMRDVHSAVDVAFDEQPS